MRRLGYISSALLLATTASALEVSGRASVDNYTRVDGSNYTFGRLQTELQIKQGFTRGASAFDLNLEGRAWGLYQKGALPATGAQDEVEFQPRNAHFSYTRGDVRVRVGYQVLNWGETFGLPPTDIMNPRDYRNYDFLDSPRNKRSIPLASLSYTLANGSMQFFVSPRRNAPRLPKTLSGVAINDANVGDRWFESAEGGARFSYVLSSMNFDITYLNQANRFPVLDQAITPTGPVLNQVVANVHTVGLSFSKGFSEVVLRADGRYTVRNPVGISPTSPVRTFMDSYSAVLGADWSPGFIEGFTIGAQGQLDRHPVPGVAEQIGVNGLVRKSLLREKLELEAQYFRGLRLTDRFLQAGFTVRPYDTWTAKAFYQSFKPDGASPLRFLGSYERIGGEIAFSF